MVTRLVFAAQQLLVNLSECPCIAFGANCFVLFYHVSHAGYKKMIFLIPLTEKICPLIRYCTSITSDPYAAHEAILVVLFRMRQVQFGEELYVFCQTVENWRFFCSIHTEVAVILPSLNVSAHCGQCCNSLNRTNGKTGFTGCCASLHHPATTVMKFSTDTHVPLRMPFNNHCNHFTAASCSEWNIFQHYKLLTLPLASAELVLSAVCKVLAC